MGQSALGPATAKAINGEHNAARHSSADVIGGGAKVRQKAGHGNSVSRFVYETVRRTQTGDLLSAIHSESFSRCHFTATTRLRRVAASRCNVIFRVIVACPPGGHVPQENLPAMVTTKYPLCTRMTIEWG